MNPHFGEWPPSVTSSAAGPLAPRAWAKYTLIDADMCRVENQVGDVFLGARFNGTGDYELTLEPEALFPYECAIQAMAWGYVAKIVVVAPVLLPEAAFIALNTFDAAGAHVNCGTLTIVLWSVAI